MLIYVIELFEYIIETTIEEMQARAIPKIRLFSSMGVE
jgi:hypothetical protein